jgi:molybdenum-dependent DNA-binding transcriptional regulator ModE
MELRHLRYFQAVAEELSFSRAARRLRIAQPALSRAVQEMERELGTQLIERERKVAAVSRLIERRGQEQSLKDQRRDQKATDEMAARLSSSGGGLMSAKSVTSSSF